jgi:hypothetical protein
MSVSMPGKPDLEPDPVRCLNAMVRGATVKYTCSWVSGFSVRWPNGMSEFVRGADGLYEFSDAAERGSRERRCLPRQSEYLEFVKQEKSEYYQSEVRLLPETVAFARELAAVVENAKLAPSELAAMRFLAAGGVSEYHSGGRFSSGSWWTSVDDPKASVTSKAMRTLCGRGYVDRRPKPADGEDKNYYSLSATGIARMAEVDRVKVA